MAGGACMPRQRLGRRALRRTDSAPRSPMQSVLWKVAALAGVIGVGCFVVFEVHRRLLVAATGTANVNDFQSLDGQSGEGSADGSSATVEAGLPPSNQGEPGDASAIDLFANFAAGDENAVAVSGEEGDPWQVAAS